MYFCILTMGGKNVRKSLLRMVSSFTKYEYQNAQLLKSNYLHEQQLRCTNGRLFMTHQIFMSDKTQNTRLPTFIIDLPPVTQRPFTPSPLPSPPHSPLSTRRSSGHLEQSKQALEEAVSKRGTKASSTSIDKYVKKVCHAYSLLESEEKEEFLFHVAKSLTTNHDHIVDLINQMPNAERSPNGSSNSRFDIECLVRWEDRLRQSLQPPYHWLAMQISRLSGGVKFIIDMRQDVLNVLASQSPDRESQTALKAFDANLRDLLSLWFTVGLLKLQRITWESSCDILQKISEYEAVHPIRSWTDLKKRVGNYRRCFVFTHACMPNEPLVVLHTFLTNEISHSMGQIVQSQRYLSSDDSSVKVGEELSSITTAIFYSITSTQKGLKGIELGNYLIKKVVKELQADIPHLTRFSSLSPIPGFVKWLHNNLVKTMKGDFELFTVAELQKLQLVLGTSSNSETYTELRGLLKTNGWSREDKLNVILEAPLMRLCAFYLYCEKRRGYALDSVANFHLRNGAVMWRLNWNADVSPRGMDYSCGIMVNYRYFLEDCEMNSRNYLETSQIPASASITELATIAESICTKN